MSDTMRDAFETRFKSLDLSTEQDSWGVPQYKHSHVDALWTGWQAAQSQPAPPVPQSVQEIMRLMNPYVWACMRIDRTPESEKAATDAFKLLEAALTALVDDNHRLKFELDGVNAMRGPLTDERILAGVKEFADENYFANYQDDILRCVRSLFGHGIEPEQGGNHG